MEKKAKEGDIVVVCSGDDYFKGTVQEIEWDLDQWAYMVNDRWYCTSEITKSE